jgi:predicted HTH transcriptional regulator
MNEQMIEDLLSRRQKPSLQNTISPRQSLTFKQLQIYYQDKNLEPGVKFTENLDLHTTDGKYNFVAYLLADSNGVSVKIAKYAGTDKVDLIENEEYGYRCLITATNQVLNKLEVENRTFAKITSKRRLEKNMVDKVALREAVINAIVHNDYTLTVPLIEIYSDRITVTSAGGLVEGLTQEDFFNCRSMPRNRELMRVFKDVELVEHLGSGMKRILKAYDRSIFEFTPSFTVITFPFEEEFILPNDKINGRLNDRIKTTIEVLKENPRANATQLAELTGKSIRTISRELKEYQEAGLIRREGSKKTGHWVIL